MQISFPVYLYPQYTKSSKLIIQHNI